MPTANFAYASLASDPAGSALRVSVFADRARLRGEISDDAQGAGFAVAELGGLDALIEGAARPLGDVVVVDCPRVDAARLVALARLDLRARHSGAQVVVSTTLSALDAVFGCLDQSGAQILVDPTRAERLIALGRALAAAPGQGVRELSEEDRLALVRLTEQVTQIAQRLDRFDGAEGGWPAPGGSEASAFRFDTARGGDDREDSGDRLVRATRPALPDPRLVRRIIRQRQLRARYFEGDLFADPAWDMLLDLAAARAEHLRVSVTSLCIASGVPPTTALRWIGQMVDAGLLQRIDDETDRRRAFIALTDKAADAMARYFAELGSGAARLV